MHGPRVKSLSELPSILVLLLAVLCMSLYYSVVVTGSAGIAFAEEMSEAGESSSGAEQNPEQTSGAALADEKAVVCEEGERASDSDGEGDSAVSRFVKAPKLRPCCAFGHSLRTTISGSSVPVKLDNILYPDQLGNHSYRLSDIQTEQNGLIYTCRAGVVDLAHIRDYADWTAYLYERIRLVVGSGAVIPIADEAAKRKIVIRLPGVSLSDAEKDELALLLAQRISFKLSVWHEIVTWYDHRSVELFSERLSSFSPEDMFSNALGAKLGADALRSGKPYDEAMDDVLYAMIHKLAPLPNKQSKLTLNEVDGVWWDRKKSMPDMSMVTRRNLDAGDTITPWIIPDEYSPYCRDRKEDAFVMPIPMRGPQNLLLTDLYELRFSVLHEQVPKFILPDKENPWVTEEDFPWIIENIRRDVLDMFGPFGDSPAIDLYDMNVEPRYSSNFDPKMPCGPDDESCKQTRREETHGINIGKLRVAAGNYPGMIFGFTLADGETMGGMFRVLTLSASVAFTDSAYTIHAKAIESPILHFCSVKAEDGSDREEIDYPFVNPFAVKCVPGSSWGIKLDLLEMLYDSEPFDGSADSFGFRPIEFGIVFNPLGNGFTPGFLERKLLLSVGIAPEIIVLNLEKATRRDASLMGYFTLIYDRSLFDDKFSYKLFGGIRDDLTNTNLFNVEGGVRLQYNHLWSRRDFRGGEPLHSIINFGVEIAVNYWYEQRPSLPSMIKSTMIGMQKDYIPDSWNISGHAIFYIETTIPKLGMF